MRSGGLDETSSLAEELFESVFALALLLGWWGLGLATTGEFRPSILAVAVAPAAFLLGLTIRRRIQDYRAESSSRSALRPSRGVDLAVPLLIAATLAWNGAPSEYVIGGRDHGVYVNTGLRIAASGSLVFQDVEAAKLRTGDVANLFFPDVQPIRYGFPRVWSRPSRLPGFYFQERSGGGIIGHGFHLYPVWIAIGATITGVRGALWITPIFAASATLALFLILRRLFGRGAAAIGAAGLVTGVCQTWYARVPSAEILCEVLVLGGLLCLERGTRLGRGGSLVLAGIAFGELGLAKIDGALLGTAVVLSLLILDWRRWRLVLLGWAPVAVHSALHAAYMATSYTLDVVAIADHDPGFLTALTKAASASVRSKDVWARLLTAHTGVAFATGSLLVALIAGASLLAAQGRRLWAGGGSGPGNAVLKAVLLAGALLGAGLLLHGSTLLKMLRLYYGTPLLGASAVGWLILLGRRSGSGDRLPLIVVVAAGALEWLAFPQAFSDEHFWAARRLVTTAVPAVFFGLAALASPVLGRIRDTSLRRIVIVAVMGIVYVRLATTTIPFREVNEFGGAMGTVHTLGEIVAPRSICLVEDDAVGRHIALPLWTFGVCETFLLQRAAVDDVRMPGLLERWHDDGSHVYWVGSPGAPPHPPGRFLPIDRGGALWGTFVVPGVRGRLPEEPVSVTWPIAVFEFSA